MERKVWRKEGTVKCLFCMTKITFDKIDFQCPNCICFIGIYKNDDAQTQYDYLLKAGKEAKMASLEKGSDTKAIFWFETRKDYMKSCKNWVTILGKLSNAITGTRARTIVPKRVDSCKIGILESNIRLRCLIETCEYYEPIEKNLATYSNGGKEGGELNFKE